MKLKCVKGTGAQNIGQGHRVKIPAESVHLQYGSGKRNIFFFFISRTNFTIRDFPPSGLE